jgi:hypothetical protein
VAVMNASSPAAQIDCKPSVAPSVSYASGTRAWLALSAAVLVYVALFAFYYPPLPGIEDEIGFINQGILFAHGSATTEGAGCPPLFDFIEFNGHHVTRRNPGESLLLIPLLLVFGLKSVFVLGAVVHVFLTLVAGLVLERIGKSPFWAVLVLCHPTLVLYSRTIMGDAGAGLGLLLALYALVAMQKPGLWAGLSVGFAAAMRYHAGLVLPFLATAIAFTAPVPRRKREGLKCLVGGGFVGLLLVLYNYRVYGNLIGITEGVHFTFSSVPMRALMLAAAFLVLWPGMLFAPLFDQSEQRWLVRALAVPIVGLFLVYTFFDRGANWGQTLVMGQRLLQPALPVWIVCYAYVLDDQLVSRMKLFAPARSAVVLLGAVGLMASIGLIFRAHQQHLQHFLRARAEVLIQIPRGATVVANTTVAKLFGLVPDATTYNLIVFNAQLHMLSFRDDVGVEGKHFYLVLMPKYSTQEFGGAVDDLVQHYRLHKLASAEPGLMLFESGPQK